MSEMSREEAIKWLKKSAPICVCTPNAFERFGFAINKAISDMQKLEKIENTKPIQLIDDFGDLPPEKFNKISHRYSQAKKLEKIEKRIAEFQNGTDMFKGMDEAYVVFAIEDILKEV